MAKRKKYLAVQEIHELMSQSECELRETSLIISDFATLNHLTQVFMK